MKDKKDYIEITKNLFDFNNPNKLDMKKQKKHFGFSIFILDNNNINKAIELGILNSREILEKHKSLFQIPHFYIFGGILLGFILLFISNKLNSCIPYNPENFENIKTYMYPYDLLDNFDSKLKCNTFLRWNVKDLFLPIILIVLLITNILPTLSKIKEKITFFKKTRVFFNVDEKDIKKITNDYFKIKPFVRKKQIWKDKYGNESFDGNSYGGRLFLFLFAQPFIFGHVRLISKQSLLTILLFDFLIFLIVFGIWERIILILTILYYKIYFYLLDKFPVLFGEENKQYDFYYDLYKHIIKTIKSLETFEDKVKRFKKGEIDKNISKDIQLLFNNIDKFLFYIKGLKEIDNIDFEIFKKYLKGLINQIIEEYKEGLEDILGMIKKLNEENIERKNELGLLLKIIKNKDKKIKELEKIITKFEFMIIK